MANIGPGGQIPYLELRRAPDKGKATWICLAEWEFWATHFVPGEHSFPCLARLSLPCELCQRKAKERQDHYNLVYEWETRTVVIGCITDLAYRKCRDLVAAEGNCRGVVLYVGRNDVRAGPVRVEVDPKRAHEAKVMPAPCSVLLALKRLWNLDQRLGEARGREASSQAQMIPLPADCDCGPQAADEWKPPTRQKWQGLRDSCSVFRQVIDQVKDQPNGYHCDEDDPIPE